MQRGHWVLPLDLLSGRFLVELPPRDSIRADVNWTSTTSVLEVADVVHTALSTNHSKFAGTVIIKLLYTSV